MKNSYQIFSFFNFNRYVDHIIIYHLLCQEVNLPPGSNFKKENKVAIFTFFEVF